VDHEDTRTGAALSCLLVPVGDEPAARYEGSARAVRLLGYAAAPLGAAGTRLEDVMVGEEDGWAADAATRLVVLPPLTHPEPVDAVGAITKLVEAAGLVLALRLLHTPAGRAKALPALREGAGP
jgi:hypothetical protein